MADEEDFKKKMKNLQDKIWDLNLKQADTIIELTEIEIQLKPLQAREQAILARMQMIEQSRQSLLQQYRNFQKGKEAVEEIKNWEGYG